MSKRTYTLKNKSKRKYEMNIHKKELKINKISKIDNIRNLLNEGKLDFAYENIINYIDCYGEDCYVIHQYARYYYLIGDIEASKETYLKNIKNNSANKYYSMCELAKIEKGQGHYNSAISLLKEILNSDHTEKFHAEFELARVYCETSRYEEAKAIFYKIINTDDDSEIFKNIKKTIYIYLTQAEINTENFDRARELIRTHQCDLEEFEYKLLMGQLELHMKNYHEARKIFYNIIDNCNEGINKALHYLIEVEYKLFNYSQVIEICKQLLANGYNYEDTLVALATTYIRIKNPTEARKCVDLLKEYDRLNDIDILMGKIYFCENDYEKAIEYFNKVSVEDTRVYADILYAKICSYIKLEKIEEAYLLLDQFIRTDKDNKFYKKIILIKFYLEKKMGLKTKPIKYTYTSDQMEIYDKEYAIDHIRKHESEDEDKPIHTIFNENIDIEDIYYYCKAMISDETFYKNTFLDVYVIPYENVGTLGDKILNNLKVVTLTNTDKIVAIYPADLHDSKPIKTKIKKISRIDKFNQKYGYRKDKVK